MFNPGARKIRELELIEITERGLPPNHFAYPCCGAVFELASSNARRRWANSTICPECWAKKPTVRFLVTSGREWRGKTLRWFPTCRVEVGSSSAQGFSTDPEEVSRIRRIIGGFIEGSGLARKYPGIDFDSPNTLLTIHQIIREIRGLPVHLEIGGKYAERTGLEWYGQK